MSEASYQVCDPLTPEEYEALKSSIAEHGIRVPIEVDEEGNILDGHNRAAIAVELRIPCPTTVKTGLETDEQKRRYARELNCARRQMTPEKKRKIVEDILRENAGISNTWIAEIVGLSHNTVIAIREELQRTSQIDRLTELKGRDGKMRKAEQTKPERFPWLNNLGWEDWHRMEARSYLRKLNEEEKDTLSSMIARLRPAHSAALALLRGMAQLPQAKRARVVELWASEDDRNQDRAVKLANGQPAPPDPRIAQLEGGYGYIQQAIRAYPNDTETPDLKEIAFSLRAVIQGIQSKQEED